MQKEIKSASTNDVYQSTFMPLFEKAEKTIKKIIITYFLLKMSRFLLISALNKYINELDKKIPKDIENRQDYIDGLKFKTGKWVIEYYNKPTEKFINYVHIIKKQALGINDQKIVSLIENIETPKDLANFITNHGKDKVVLRMFEQAKGSVRILDYPKQIQEAMDRLAKQPLTTHEKGKKPISLWQKAELDIRHSNQMAMVEKCKDSGDDLWWISSHPDCSKRCEKWQGKLVSVNRHATMSGFRVEKVDGQWAYSLTDIMAQTDKYGYNNNIISGFNCFDKETKVLTNHGWKLFSELNTKDLVYTLNPKTKLTEWQKPINYFKKFYNGDMMKLKSNTSDLLVTPNHQMLYYTQFNKELRFEDAKKTKKTHNQYAGQNWVGNNQNIVKVGNVEVDAKLFCRFLGYYLADGSLHSKTAIKIAQQNNAQMLENLKDLHLMYGMIIIKSLFIAKN